MGRVKGRPWTPQDDEVLRKLAAARMSVAAIAGEMGRSDTTIRRHLKAERLARDARALKDGADQI